MHKNVLKCAAYPHLGKAHRPPPCPEAAAGAPAGWVAALVLSVALQINAQDPYLYYTFGELYQRLGPGSSFASDWAPGACQLGGGVCDQLPSRSMKITAKHKIE